MSSAVLSIGSNLGDSLAHLQSVLDGVAERVDAVSGVYSTAPWGGVEQQNFLNAVVLVSDSNLDCWGWLRLGQALEHEARRIRDERWGPRTLDVDVIVCGDVSSEHPDLILPHPRAHERAFVLVPWLDADPDANLAGTSVVDLVAALPDSERQGVVHTDLTLHRRGRK